MRTFLVVLNWSPEEIGGCSEVASGVAQALQDWPGLRVMIVVATDDPAKLPRQFRGIPVVGLPLRNGLGESGRGTLYVARWLPLDLWTIYRFLRANRVAGVVSVFPGSGGAALVLLRKLGLYRGHLAVSFQGLDVTAIEQANRFSKTLWGWYLGGLDQVFCCSGSIRDRVARLAPLARLRVLFNGADLAAFRPAETPPPPSPVRILHIGKFERKKAQDVLLSAFRIVLDKGVDAHLTMIGAPGPETGKTREAASVFGSRVRMIESVPHDRIPGYFAESSLFVLPSREEPFGIVLVEAGAAGLPVVATRVGGIPEFLTHGRTALLVEPDNPEELAEAILRMARTEGLASSLAQAWHEESAKFSWSRVAEKYLEGIDGVGPPERGAATVPVPAASPDMPSVGRLSQAIDGWRIDASLSRSTAPIQDAGPES